MLYTLLFLLLTYLILTHPEVSLHYAFQGFSLWYSKMIPALVPFMILSGIVIRMNMTEKFVALLHPILKRIYKCTPNVSYGLIIGFLCGFPMGAKTCADLIKNQKISKREAEFLLAFNNNIGPVYFTGFVIPLFGITHKLPFLFGMYGIPLLYGLLLRYTTYKDLNMFSFDDKYAGKMKNKKEKLAISFLEATDESIHGALQSILMLCGYMILFNTLNLLPHFLFPAFCLMISPVLEITGGLTGLGNSYPIYSLCLLHFGGLSCIAQTNSMLRSTDLSLQKYIEHKIHTALLAAVYYLFLFRG